MTAIFGVFFHWLGGLAAGSFYVPFRKVRNWSWESYWLVNGVFAWLISPWLFGALLTTGPVAILEAVDPSTLLYTYLCGVCWGIGGLTFGLTLRYLGMSLGMAIALGYTAAFGTLVPPIVDGTFVGHVWQPLHGKVVLCGVLVCLAGIGVAGWAGNEKESGMTESEKRATIREFNFPKGITIATFSGIMSAFFAYGFRFGQPIVKEAMEQGTASHWAGLPSLIVILAGGFTTNFIWCVILNLKNRSGYEYFASRQRSADGEPRIIVRLNNYFFSGMAGVIWYFQFFFYQIGESKMGEFKFSSWTLHMASIIIFSSLWGLGLGEWKGSSTRARGLLYTGLFVLIASTLIIGMGNWMGSSGRR